MRANRPQVVQHHGVEPLDPGHLPLDCPVGDHDVAHNRVEHIDQLQPELVIQEVTAGSVGHNAWWLTGRLPEEAPDGMGCNVQVLAPGGNPGTAHSRQDLQLE